MYAGMNFLKDKISAILLTAIIMLACVCVSGQSKKKEVATKGFVNSKVFKDYLKHYDDKEAMTYSHKRLFNLINEEAFLNCEQYDFYIVYFFKGSQDTRFKIYVLHSRDGITVSSCKSFNKGFPLFDSKKGDKEPSYPFEIDVSNRIIKKEQTVEIKNALDKAKKNIHDRFPAYDIPTRVIYYYDGQNYHALSDYKIPTEAMDRIDNLFKSSSLFK
jgi:hypothetical protein